MRVEIRVGGGRGEGREGPESVKQGYRKKTRAEERRSQW